MLEWMSRILVGEMAGADEDFGSEVGQMWLIFDSTQTPNPTQHDPCELYNPFRTIHYHPLRRQHMPQPDDSRHMCLCTVWILRHYVILSLYREVGG
jgi:hypothetical protein